MKIIFLSFADKRYSSHLHRIGEQARHFPFDEVYTFNEDSLPKDYLHYIRPHHYPRGFGYWRWKSYIVKRQMNQMQDGDILFYSDVGNQWNTGGMSRFQEYINMLCDPQKGNILAFEEPYLEKDYCKGDIIIAAGVQKRMDIMLSLQLWGGCFAIRKCSESIKVVSEWYKLTHDNYHLITDKRSITPNPLGFIEHRHDQSAFSLIVKQHPHVIIGCQEQCALTFCRKTTEADWLALANYPIHAKRIIHTKNQSLTNNVKNKLIKLLHLPRNLCLRYFENFFFNRRWPSW